MILGRNILTGQLVYGNGTPICRSCWNGFHHRCKVQADEYNKCECAKWGPTRDVHFASVLFKQRAPSTTSSKQ